MENWALITYNDRVLLYFPGETTEQERYRITTITSHEVAHHYFGNLVTCEWWTWIWLNEGFATYVSHLGVQMTYPEFNPWDRFINDVYQVAMEFDATDATHPVANEPATLAAIGGIYDDIAYEKGASLLKMMQSVLTEEVVQTAIRRYLAGKQFSTARQDELFEILQLTAEDLGKAPPATVKTIMDTWTLVSGFPLVRVSRISATEVMFTQERFQSEPGNPPSDETWWIPISVKVISSTDPKEYFFWIPSGQKEFTFTIPESEVFIVNPNSDGYYRTLYTTDLLAGLLEAIRNSCENTHSESLSSSAKAKLLNDYITFMKAGIVKLDPSSIMRDFACWKSENLVVWQTLFKYFTAELLSASEHGNHTAVINIKNSMRTIQPLINDALERTQMERGEKLMLKSELLFWTCFIDPEQTMCQTVAEDGMRKWLVDTEDNLPFPVDLEETYFCIAASLNETYWEKIYELMESRLVTSAKTRLLSALTCTNRLNLLERISPLLQNDITRFHTNVKRWAVKTNPEFLPFLRMTLRFLYNENARRVFLKEMIH